MVMPTTNQNGTAWAPTPAPAVAPPLPPNRIGWDLVGWTDAQWRDVQSAVEQALAGTANCRRVIPTGGDQIGETTVLVSQIGVAAGTTTIAYQPNIIATPIHIYADVDLDDQHARTDADVIRLVQEAAALVGAGEDTQIIQGGNIAAAPAVVGGAPAVVVTRSPRIVGAGITVFAASTPGGAGGVTSIGAAAGVQPSGRRLFNAITAAMGSLQNDNRPGPYGLLLHNNLIATLQATRFSGGAHLMQEVQGLIGGNRIAGTNALDDTYTPGQVGAILFRLGPAAMDLVHTMLPTVTILGRTGGTTHLRVEEEIVLRILDPDAIEPIAY